MQRLPSRVLRTYVVLAEQDVVPLSTLYHQVRGRHLKEQRLLVSLLRPCKAEYDKPDVDLRLIITASFSLLILSLT